MPKNYEQRDAKLNRRKYGMRVTNRGVFLLLDIIGRRAKDAKANKARKSKKEVSS